MDRLPSVSLCIYGHFYQPPRRDPFSGEIEREDDAAPYHDFNEKIWDECYRPNAAEGNFERISFDLGPSLASWLEARHPATLAGIVASARAHRLATGHANALAQSYNHTILPLATPRERRLEVAWGIRDYRRRFGRAPRGMWLPETAANDEVLDELARQGISYTVLAPWQAAGEPIDPSEPYSVDAGNGRALTIFFYNGPLSGDVSFDDETTADAVRFCTQILAAHVDRRKLAAGEPQLILVATDGELYGHHKRFRDLFLARVLTSEAAAAGYSTTTLESYAALVAPRRSVAIAPDTSWSCAHGVARWDCGCPCTPGDSSWKRPLRRALRELATRLDDIFVVETRGGLRDPWAALEDYVDLRDRVLAEADFWSAHAGRRLDCTTEQRLRGLLEMEWARHTMFVSCAWFFEDLDRIEPRIALRHAAYAIALASRHAGADLAPQTLLDLASSLSLRTGRNGADLYRKVAGSLGS